MKSSPMKMKIPEGLKALPRITFCTYRKYCAYLPEVKPFLNLNQEVVDFEFEPSFWNLTPEEVAEYVTNKWNHPELKEAIITNNIDGKALILLEAQNLPKMSIKWFDVIKELTAEIRELCKIEKEDKNRGISLPYRLPRTLFLFYKASRTGPTTYYLTPSQYFRKINIIRDETTVDRRYYALLNHWNRIPPYRQWCPHVMIGGARRINPMTGTTRRQILNPGKCKCNCSRDLPCTLGM